MRYFYWTMVLDESALRSWNGKQNSPMGEAPVQLDVPAKSINTVILR